MDIHFNGSIDTFLQVRCVALKNQINDKTPGVSLDSKPALDEPGDRVRAMYREYWELSGRYELAQIYDEARYDLRGLLRLNKILKDLGLGEKEIIKVLELAKYDELQNLQWKVEYLRNEVNMLENEKFEAMNDY